MKAWNAEDEDDADDPPGPPFFLFSSRYAQVSPSTRKRIT